MYLTTHFHSVLVKQSINLCGKHLCWLLHYLSEMRSTTIIVSEVKWIVYSEFMCWYLGVRLILVSSRKCSQLCHLQNLLGLLLPEAAEVVTTYVQMILEQDSQFSCMGIGRPCDIWIQQRKTSLQRLNQIFQLVSRAGIYP